MNLLDEVFEDLIKDIQLCHKRNNNDSTVEGLRDLKSLLEGYVDSIDSDIRLESQDRSYEELDRLSDERRIEQCMNQ